MYTTATTTLLLPKTTHSSHVQPEHAEAANKGRSTNRQVTQLAQREQGKKHGCGVHTHPVGGGQFDLNNLPLKNTLPL